MSRCQQVGRPIARSLCQVSGPAGAKKSSPSSIIAVRHFSWTPSRKDEAPTTTTSTTTDATITAELSLGPEAANLAEEAMLLDPNRSTAWKEELRLMKQGTPPIGSRRRRVAIRTTGSVPFEQLPYQCFQEARRVLDEDRREKIAQILKETEKIRRLEAADPATFRDGEYHKQKRLKSLRQYVEELKIQADINDPLVKRRFEDGLGDMSKPIYRHLAKQKWLAMDHKIIAQRIAQFHIVPDLLPKFEPAMAVRLFFRGAHVAPGQLLDSRVTEIPPSLRLQAFDAGDRLLSVVVLDADVPDPQADGFAKRCHFLAANIPWDPTKSALALAHIGAGTGSGSKTGESGSQKEGEKEGPSTPVPWLPPFAQKGAPYHRLAIFVLQQPANSRLDAAELARLYGGNDAAGRENFSLKSFRDRFGLAPVGFTMFRTVWDEGTAEVMARHDLPGADVEFRPERVRSLKPPKKARGWEAKRQKPKYKSLWKYTKRIA